MKRKTLLTFLFITNSLLANEYDFSMDELEEIETKQYEYSGYLKAQHKYQKLNESSPKYTTKNKDAMNTILGEAFLNFKYFKDEFTFQTDLMANYENKDHEEGDTYTLNQAFINYKYNQNHQISLGKKVAKWGKAYFFNPIAFIDRRKDPNEPEASKEGYIQANYTYNKVFNSSLQNFAFDVVYLKTNSGINEDFYSQESDNLALKAYFLYKDIDIDLAYLYSTEQTNRFGIDFSTNIQTNFEIHAEYAKADNSNYSYLLGLKYLTEFDLTVISEYFYQSEELVKDKPFWDNRYFLNSFSQKEPLDFLYSSIYYKNFYNLEDNSQQHRLGFTYSGFENVDLDFSVSKCQGKESSEYGSKLVDHFTWLQIKYSF